MMAQPNTQYEITGLATSNSIIVEYTDDIDIVYNDNGARSFLKVDRNNMAVDEAQVTDLDEVRDMEIIDKMVYFCGKMNGSPGVGWFDISNLFSPAGGVDFISFSPTPVYSYPCSFTLRKLEVYNPSPDVIHIFLLGDMVYGSPTNYPPDYTYLVDVRFDGISWQIDYVFQDGGDYLFDDLTLTQNYLMVVGHKYTGGDYSHTAAQLTGVTGPLLYPLISAPYPTPPLHIPMHSSAAIDYNTISRQLIEALDFDEYVIASYGQFNLIPGVVFSHYTSPGVLAYRWMVPNVTTTSEFMELRRMLGAYELYLVSDHTYTGSPDFLYGSDYGSWSGLLHPNQIDILHSLDRRTNGMGMIVSGKTPGGYLGVWEAQYITTPCANETALPLDGAVHDVYDWDMEVKTDLSKGTPVYYSASLSNYPLIKICED